MTSMPSDHRTDCPGQPFLSVIMPVHEGEKWIAATLESLAAQPTDGLEIIVIDSSPTSATAEIVGQFTDRLPLQFHRRIDIKPWQTKTNLGVELSTAEHACMLHQDDLWLPERVDAARRWVADSPEAALHLAPTVIIDRNGRQIGRWNCPLPPNQILGSEFLLERLLVQNFVSVPAPIFRRIAWLECGGMDEALWYTPDWDIWLKFAVQGPVIYHDEPTTAFRIHGSSLTVTGSSKADEFRSQMQTVLDRHLNGIPTSNRGRVESAARASISVNVSLAAASGGSMTAIFQAIRSIVALGPGGMLRYLRDSRLYERVMPRLRAKLTGAF